MPLNTYEQNPTFGVAVEPTFEPPAGVGAQVSKAAEVVSALRAEAPAAKPVVTDAVGGGGPRVVEQIVEADNTPPSEANSVAPPSAAGPASAGDSGADEGPASRKGDGGAGETDSAAGGAQPLAAARPAPPRVAFAAAPEVSRHVAEQLAAGASEAAREALTHGGSRTVKVRLRPEELGAVEITIRAEEGGRLSARLTAEREATSQSLSEGLATLHDALDKAGVNLSRLDVAHGPAWGGAHSQTESRPQTESQSHTGAAPTAANFEARAQADGAESAGREAAGAERLLSVRA